jgi:hypothetical protein
MAQLFPKSANYLAPASLAALVLVAGGAVGSLLALDYAGFNQRRGETVEQTVPFSHEHHVAGLGIDCRYCHTSVEKSAVAGVPPTSTCYNCHKIVWNEAPMLEPVRASYRTGQPLEWTKVHDLPDFAYFNHSIHVAKGMGCATCHGPVHQMRLMRSTQPLQMRWCLECHRNPEKFIRPKEEIYNMTWKAQDQETLGRELVEKYKVRPPEQITSCGTCHR